MSLRALFATCAIALAGFAAAADYDLVVPRGWDYLKDAKTLVVYAPAGEIKAGDHITRIVQGGAEGPGVRVSVGWPSPASVELGTAGGVKNFSGQIILSGDKTGADGLAATLVPAGTGATSAPEDQLGHAFPWMWVFLAAGAIVLVSFAGTVFRRSQPPSAIKRFTGRKGIEEGVREIRAKIDEIQAAQENLVRKPPVLRSFRKQIEGFDHRLRDIESNFEDTTKQLTTIAGILNKLDDRLNAVSQSSNSASSDSKKAIELVNKLSTEQNARSGALEDQIKKVAAGQESLGTISRDVAKTVDSLSNLGSRIDSLAAQNLAQETKIQGTTAGIEATRKEIEKLDQRLSKTAEASEVGRKSSVEAAEANRKQIEKLDQRSAEVAEANRKQIEKLDGLAATTASAVKTAQESLNGLTSAVQSSDQRLAGIEAQAAAAAQRDAETQQRISDIAKAAEGVAGGVAKVDLRVEMIAKSTEGLFVSLQEISGRVSNTEGSLQANLHDLAAELGTLRNELGSNLQDIQGRVSTTEGSLQANLKGLAAELGTLRSEVGTNLQDISGRVSNSEGSLQENLKGLAAELGTLRSEVGTNLQDISGRVSTTEGSLQSNLKGLAEELTTLRSEVGSLPNVVNSLGDRVGSLDARLAPISEHGDKLAEGFQSLQARFEDAAVGLARQVDTLEGRLEYLQNEGSKLANLPEVANALHGNTAELAAHVRSAEGGLKALGEELAKLQEALQNDSKQSDTIADELAQRLSAWEGSLAQVASKVEDLRAPELVVAVAKPKKNGKAKAGKAAKAEPAVELTVLSTEEPQQASPEPEVELVLEATATEVVEEPAAEVEAVEEPAAEAVEVVEEEPVVEVVAEEAAPEPEIDAAAILEEAFAEEEDESTFVLERSKAGRWTEMAGSSERLWSVKMPSAKPLPSVKGPIRPLTPIETPPVDHHLGALICTGQGAAYAHGDSLRSFWPGTENKSVKLQSPMPDDLWRLMMFSGYVYCAQERQVEIIHTSTWTKHAVFQGDYLNQAHTESHWVGLMAWGEKLAVDFRDSLGNHINSPREVDASASEPYLLAASSHSVFVGSRNGSLSRVEPAGAVQICRPSDEKLLSISLTKGGVLTINQTDRGIAARLIGPDGHLLKEADLGCQVSAHAPVVINDKFYLFDDAEGELLTVNLKNLEVTNRLALESVLGVNRMIGLSCGKNTLLAIVAADERGASTRAFVLDIKTGQEMTLCPINHPRAEMVAGDGHLVIATSSAYQNTIQVFNPFEAVELKAKKVA